MNKLLVVLFVFFSISISAQEIKKTRDLGMWIGVSLKKDFKKKYTLLFSQDLRLLENLSEVDKYITDLGLIYKINKTFRIGGNIRYYLNRQNDKTMSQDFRYNLDFRVKQKIGKKIKIKYRFRYQNSYENPFAAISEGSSANIRNRLKLEYDLNKKNTTYVSAELFRKIVNYREPYFNALRFLVGNEIETKVGKFDFSFGYTTELNAEYPLSIYFGKIYYTIDI